MITLVHPSRGRADKSYKNSSDWLDKSGVPDEVELIFSVDISDPQMDRYASLYLPAGGTSNPKYPRIRIVTGDNRSVVEATNRAAKFANGDILIYLSDDFQCFDNWGVAVINEFSKYSSPTLIKVDDCLQPNFTRVLTIPMMNRALYDKLGYFWHPDYKSMWVDCDLYETAERLRALRMATHLKFPHIHPGNPDPKMRCENDETYKRSAANWEQGKAVFQRRKAAGFPV